METPGRALTLSDFDFAVARSTIFRDFKRLCALGVLRLEGKSYRLDQKSQAYVEWDVSRPPHQRPKVAYNSALLADYQPNRSSLLLPEQLAYFAACHKPSPEVVENKRYHRLLNTLLIDLTYASSNLEDVRISWLDTKTLIEFGERPEWINEKQLKLVLNHKEAINYLNAHRDGLTLNQREVFNIHTLLTTGLIANPAAIGNLRNVVVHFEESAYIPPTNPHLLREAFETFCEKAQAIENPFEQAFFIMLFIPYLQPFQDGNKRTSRLCMNIPLIANELHPFSFSDISKRDYMFGLLAFYERGNAAFLAESFVKAYSKTLERYAALTQHLEEGGVLASIKTGTI